MLNATFSAIKNVMIQWYKKNERKKIKSFFFIPIIVFLNYNVQLLCILFHYIIMLIILSKILYMITLIIMPLENNCNIWRIQYKSVCLKTNKFRKQNEERIVLKLKENPIIFVLKKRKLSFQFYVGLASFIYICLLYVLLYVLYTRHAYTQIYK